MKKQIKSILNLLGYDIQRIPQSTPVDKQECHSRHEMQGAFYSHNKVVDIYQYADHQSPHVLTFKKKISDKTYDFINCSCAICKSNDYTLVSESDEGFTWSICKKCGLLQINRRLKDRDIETFYKSGEYQAICMGNLDDNIHFSLEHRIMSLYFIDIFNLLKMKPEETNVIEIGCGSGGILLALKEWGAKVVKGYDIDEYRVNYGKKYISEIEFGDALSLDPEVYSNYNLVLLSNVLEHLIDPMEFLNKLSLQIKSQNISVVIDIPNLEYCYSYSSISFSKFLHIAHLWYFNSITIERLLNSVGFCVDYIFTRGAGFTVICSKRTQLIDNNNNGYWNSVSAINYANHLNDPNNISVVAKETMNRL